MAVGDSPTAWSRGISLLPSELQGHGSEPETESERAMHRAITLYAIHQQSLDVMAYVPTVYAESSLHGLGHAVNELAYLARIGKLQTEEQLEQGQMPRRFAALVTANNLDEASHYARQLIQQLRSESIPLDYGALAGQLLAYQYASQTNQVRLEWSREFAQWRAPQSDPKATDPNKE